MDLSEATNLELLNEFKLRAKTPQLKIGKQGHVKIMVDNRGEARKRHGYAGPALVLVLPIKEK